MSHIRSTEKKPEIFFRKALWKWGVRYRKNVRGLLGNPDIAIKKYKIVIFIDGDFWHGHDRKKLASYSLYWQNKIKRNIERDKKVNRYYRKNKWTILRFWVSVTEKDLNRCIIKTVKIINRLKERVS
jgi:DNA mismatch endonuclease (patch repair protein)